VITLGAFHLPVFVAEIRVTVLGIADIAIAVEDVRAVRGLEATAIEHLLGAAFGAFETHLHFPHAKIGVELVMSVR